jgi:tetratricopeptide (TPR) repeat protein
MAAVLLSSASAVWLSINVAGMILLVRTLGTNEATAVTACSRPRPDDQVIRESQRRAAVQNVRLILDPHKSPKALMNITYRQHLVAILVSVLSCVPAAATTNQWQQLKMQTGGYIETGKYQKAEVSAKAMLAVAEASGNSRGAVEQVTQSLGMLAMVYGIQKRYPEQEAATLRTVKLYEQMFGKESNAISGMLTTLARIYTIQGKLLDAEAVFKRVLAIKEKATPNNLTAILIILGQHYELQKKYIEAEASYKRALILGEKERGDRDPSLKPLLSGLANLSRVMGKPADAKKYAARDAAIRD